MPHKIIKLRHELTDAEVQAMADEHRVPSAKDYDYVVTGHTTVLKPNGEALLKLLPGSLSFDVTQSAFSAFHGKLANKEQSYRTAMKTSQNAGSEGVIGFMEARYPFTYCRATALSANHAEEFKQAYPFILSAAKLMQQHLPERYEAQELACKEVHPDYIIPGTPYSTVTVNQDVTATYHTDKGDYKPGIGVLSAVWAVPTPTGWKVVWENPSAGGLLVFPKYRVAVLLRSTDLLLADVHEVHGVTPITGEVGTWSRISFVLYLREEIHKCASMQEEIEKVAIKDEAKHKKKAA